MMEYTIVGVGQFFDFASKEYKDTLQVRGPDGEVHSINTTNECVHELVRLASGLRPVSKEAPEDTFQDEIEPEVFGGHPDSFGDEEDELSPEVVDRVRESIRMSNNSDFPANNRAALIARLEEAKRANEPEDLDGDEDRQI